MSHATEIAARLRSLGDMGTTNHKADKALCYEAAALIEDMEERIDIMMEGNRITPGAAVQTEMNPYEYRDEMRY